MTNQIPISFIAFGTIKEAIKDIPETFTEAQKFQDIPQLHELNNSTPIVLRDDNNKLIPFTCTIKDFLKNYDSENPISISVGKFYVIYIPSPNIHFKKHNITLECSISAILDDLLSLFPKTFKKEDHIYLQPCDSIFLYDDTNEKIEKKWQNESEAIEIQVNRNIDVVKFTFLNSFEDPNPTLFYINKANPTTFQDVYGDFYDQYEFEISILEEETKTVINNLSAQVDPNKSYLILPKSNFPNETDKQKGDKITEESSQSTSLTTSTNGKSSQPNPLTTSTKGKSSQSKEPSPPKSDPSTTNPRQKVKEDEKPSETNDQGEAYSFKFSNQTNYFSVSVLKTDKVRDVIQKILETHKDLERIALFVGTRGNEEQLDKDDIFSKKVTTNQIVLVKTLLRYIINYPGGSSRHKNYVPETTVGDVRGIFKQKHLQDCMLYDKNDKLLEDETLLKTLPDLTFTIKIPTPVYNFEITNTFTDQIFSKEVEIPDHTNVNDCRNILKNAIPELKDYHENQITIDVDFQSIFGETIQPPGPISVTISNPTYTWYICNSTLRGVDKYGLDELTFPLNYTIQDVIDQFESENPCYSYAVLDETKKELDTSINLFEHQLFDQTCKIERRNKEFSLAIANQPTRFVTFIPKAEWPLGVTAQFLTYSNNSISFTSKKPIAKAVIPKYPIDSCDWHNRLEFTHNGKTYSKDTTFQELKFEKGEEDDTSITVTLAPPTLHFSTLDNTYSFPEVDNFLSKNKSFQLFNNFVPIDSNDDRFPNPYIQCVSYEHKVEFTFIDTDNYIIYVNDENMTIKEMKAMIFAYLLEKKHKALQLSQIQLSYKGRPIKCNTYKEISYKEGDVIDVTIGKRKITVEYEDGNEETYEIDDDVTTVEEFGRTQNFTVTLSRSQLKTPVGELRKVTASRGNRIIVYNKQSYPVDKYNTEEKLQTYLQNEIGIDLSKATFTTADKQKVTLQTIIKTKKINVYVTTSKPTQVTFFEDTKLNGKFYSNQSIKEVRDYIKKDKKNDKPLILKCNNKYLANNTRLFQITSGKITYEFLTKAKQCQISHGTETVKEFIPLDMTCEEFYCYTSAKFTPDLVFSSGGNTIPKDESLLLEYGDQFESSIPGEDKINFIINNKLKTAKYLSSKTIAQYKKELKIEHDILCVAEGKVFDDPKATFAILENVNPDERKVSVYDRKCIYYHQEVDDMFKSANCVKFYDKPVIKLNEITISDIDDPDKLDKYPIDPNTELTVYNIKELIAARIRIPVDQIALFILFVVKAGEDYALLKNDANVSKILTTFSGQNIAMKILPKAAKAPNTRQVSRLAKTAGLTLTENEMIYIATQTKNDPVMIQTTLEFWASEQ